ncbi:MAG: hypothetical protein ACTSR1_12845 [Candidatus Heimdallarchaeota archaeon]
MPKLLRKYQRFFSIVFVFLLIAIFIFSNSIVTSKANSATWSDRFTVSNKDDYDDRRCTMILDDNNNLHVVWNEDIDNNWQLKYRQLVAATNSWTAISSLSISGIDIRAQTPILTKDSQGIIHLTWWEVNYDLGTSYQNYRYYSEGSWSNTVNLTEFSFASEYYNFVSLNNNELLFIFDNEYNASAFGIHYQIYNWNTQTYGSKQQLTNSSYPFHYPNIIIDSQHFAHLCWSDYANSTKKELLYQRFDGSWSPAEPIVISQIDNLQVTKSQMCIDSNDNIHFLYVESNSTYGEIHHRVLSEDVLVTNQTLEHGSKFFIDNSDTIHFIWQETSLESTMVIAYQQLFQNGSWSTMIEYDTGLVTAGSILHVINSKGSSHFTWSAYDDNDWVIYYVGYNIQYTTPTNAIILPIASLIAITIPIYYKKKLRKKSTKKKK